MFLFPLLLIFIIIFLFLGVFDRGNNFNNGNANTRSTALDILDRRFANGEISEEEYLKRKALLK